MHDDINRGSRAERIIERAFGAHHRSVFVVAGVMPAIARKEGVSVRCTHHPEFGIRPCKAVLCIGNWRYCLRAASPALRGGDDALRIAHNSGTRRGCLRERACTGGDGPQPDAAG